MRKNKAECFRNVLLWKMKTFMLTETHNWKNDKNKIKKRDLKGKAKQETPKNRNNWWKKPFKCNIFSWNKRKETRQERTTKKTRKEKSTRKQGINKKNKKQERQRVKKEKWKKPRRKKGIHWEMNKITCFQGKTGENSVFAKDKNTKY